MEKYVIKNRFGQYVNTNEHDGKKLDYFLDDDQIDVAKQYADYDIKMIQERFIDTWRDDGFKVFKIIITLEAVESHIFNNIKLYLSGQDDIIGGV